MKKTMLLLIMFFGVQSNSLLANIPAACKKLCTPNKMHGYGRAHCNKCKWQHR